VKILFVVNRQQDWPFEIPGSGAVTARAYLTDPAHSSTDAQVVNLCRADRYQGRGYYVSLLAEARGHRPLPDVKTIEDLQARAHLDALADELDPLVQRSLSHDASDMFELDAYFGRDPAELHPALAQHLFAVCRAALIRAVFERTSTRRWRLQEVRAIGVSDIPPQHRAFLRSAATEYVTGKRRPPACAGEANVPTVAILRDEREIDRPSNDRALQKFVDAAPSVGLRAEIIGRDDLERLKHFDGLFIRTTTNVGHWTYEFARRAAALGMPVMDDPDSILKCTNKVYLHELMARHGIPTPKTVMVHRENLHQVVPTLGLPCILKQPDGGFGLGVVKIADAQQLVARATQLLERSELLIAQEWLPTPFDWRVCVLDRRPLFACKYFMAPGHWQVIKRDSARRVEGQTVAYTISEAPECVIGTAVRAANLIGDSLYGVDLKQVGDECYLIEVNDNPNIDAGNEDQILKDALYREVMGVYARRIAA
jgi:glutathione synthase/RimK-type ligase-like ATP-grasp enzyme